MLLNLSAITIQCRPLYFIRQESISPTSWYNEQNIGRSVLPTFVRKIIWIVKLCQTQCTKKLRNLSKGVNLHKSVISSFSVITVCLCIFWEKEICKKAARKMLLKLIPDYNMLLSHLKLDNYPRCGCNIRLNYSILRLCKKIKGVATVFCQWIFLERIGGSTLLLKLFLMPKHFAI